MRSGGRARCLIPSELNISLQEADTGVSGCHGIKGDARPLRHVL